MDSKMSVSAIAKSEMFSGILMIISFVLALFVSNTPPLSQFYVTLVFSPISLEAGNFLYNTALITLVNDCLMTFFFLLIGLELKYHLVLGEYQNRKTLILPAAAAIGGVILPALIYTFFNFGQSTAKGWAITIATDTAFMLGILGLFHQHISPQLRAFIISFSLIDDALALAIMAIFYTKSLDMIAVGIALSLLAFLILLNWTQVKNSCYYLIVGIFLWVAMAESGIHGALCGAILALTIPVTIREEINHSFKKLEHIVRPLVYYFILPLFVFTNSGIKLESLPIMTNCLNLSLGIILGLFPGKQFGIFGFSYIAIKSKWCQLPAHTTFTKFYAVSILGGIGFTLSLFIGGLAFEKGCPHYSMRSAVIIGSLISALVGTMLFAYSIKQKAN